jgi:uncharacterized protein YijF (DUF1287 family)
MSRALIGAAFMRIQATASLLLLLPFTVLAQSPQGTFSTRLVNAAIERTLKNVSYDGSYRRLEYPGGDVPDDIGVCTDLVIRSYRAVGLDLQQLVHEDMKAAFSAYPQRWDLSRPDSNIDHRRVPNLQVFFSRHGVVHIGIISDRWSPDGARPLVVHNIANGPELEDMLFRYRITGHYRYVGQD